MGGLPDFVKEGVKFAVNPPGYVARKTLGLVGVKVPDFAGDMLGLNSEPGQPGAPPGAPPPPPPDLTEEHVQRARAAMVRRALMGQGLGSTFLTGPLGDLSKAPASTPGLGGM